LPELLIVVVKASPVLAKFVETVLVDIFDSIDMFLSVKILLSPPQSFFDSLNPVFVVFVLDVAMLTTNFIYCDGGHKNTVELPHCTEMNTYTLLAHLVTLLPSFKHFISPCPAFSVLHCMKSSLYGLHLAPIKKLADSNGAELAPISVTGGMSAGRGAVSIRVVWLNLQLRIISTVYSFCVHLKRRVLHRFSSRHLEVLCRDG
jgi:hypothetical protein